MNAKKDTYGEAEALKLLQSVSQVFSAKGQKVVHWDLRKDKPDPPEVLKLLLGPTGNLRAPTLRVGKTLLVGFNSGTYEQVFGIPG